MARVPEDLPRNEIKQLIGEGEARRTEQLLVLQTQPRPDQEPNDARQNLQAIDEVLAALRCRRSYLQAMQETP